MVSTTTDRRKATVHIRISTAAKEKIDLLCTERLMGVREATEIVIQAGLKALAEKEAKTR